MSEHRTNRAVAEQAAREAHEKVIRTHLSGGGTQITRLKEAMAYFTTGPGSSCGVFSEHEWATLLRMIGRSPRSKIDFKGTFRPS